MVKFAFKTNALGMRSHSAAVAMCSQVGARLCTYAEMDEFHQHDLHT